MYVDSSTVRSPSGKSYTRQLLRESYRENGKVRHRTIANLSSCSSEEIEAIRLALRHKDNLKELTTLKDDLSLQQGLSVGAVWTVFEVARQLGIVDALGSHRQGKLALWQVIARVIEQGSRLSAVRLAGSHAACDILDLGKFDEDDCYENLDWLCEHQAEIEGRLFHREEGEQGLFLYDVTSSYLEGMHNELGAFGYNRDRKRGKRQIVIGLLCNGSGVPLSVEVFRGNTTDGATFGSQVRKVAERFGGGEITFVGDRGMIKSGQIKDLAGRDFHYITAITKPQIETLLRSGVLQMELFDEKVAEVKTDDGIRYVFRRNPVRAEELGVSRRDKKRVVMKEVEERNRYLAEHARANVEVALRKVSEKIKRLKLSGWLHAEATGREMILREDAQALAEESKLDGCYVLKTDLTLELASTQIVHDRYKDLALVEWAFRSSKTVHLETRPIYVRLESRTRGHVLVVMLAYRIISELARRWQDLDLTVEEGIGQLKSLCATIVCVNDEVRYNRIPKPRESVQQLLSAATVRLPDVIPHKGVTVTTKKKLPSSRKKR
jgi:transposase